jgi:hypothetical protein
MRTASAKWCGTGYDKPATWAFKKDMPALNPGVTAILVEFPFECVFVQRDHEHKVLMADGHWMPVLEFYSVEFGRLLGPRDMSAGEHTPYCKVWRELIAGKIYDELTMNWKT